MNSAGEVTSGPGRAMDLHLPGRRFDVALEAVWTIPPEGFARCITQLGATITPPATLRSSVATTNWLVEDDHPLTIVVPASQHPLQQAWVTAARSADRVERVVVETCQPITAESGAVLVPGWYEMTIIDLSGLASVDLVMVAIVPSVPGTHQPEVGTSWPTHSSTFRLRLDDRDVITGASLNVDEILQRSSSDLVGSPAAKLIHPEDLPSMAQRWQELRADPGRLTSPLQLRVARGEADWNWYEATSWNAGDEQDPDLILVECRDIQRQVTAEVEREITARAHERLVKIVDQSEDLVLVARLGHGVVHANDAAERFFGFDPRGMRLRELLPEGPQAAELLAELEPQLHSFSRWTGELDAPDAGGNLRTMATTLIRVFDELDDTSYFGAILRDVTEDRSHARELATQARVDHLTSLPNRLDLVERLAAYRDGDRRAAGTPLRTRRGTQPLLAVYFIDLDNLKVVNDSLGHTAGDQVLIAVADALTAGTEGLVTRFGGDEFVVIEEVHDQHHAEELAGRLLERVEEVRVAEISSHLSASIGLALSEPAEVDPDGILRNADAAMYEAKRRGKACWVTFDDMMREQVTRRFVVETSLRDAIDQHRLAVHLQPVISIEEGRITAFESLARWGVIEPSVFVATAEESGLIVPLGRWVLEASLEAITSIRAAHAEADDIRIAVNVSGRQLIDTSFADFVLSSIRNHRMDPNEVVLELTESAIIDSHDDVTQTLRSLSDAGVALALDDFGSGYSSLGYLRRYPIQVLKLDHSYTHGLMQDPETRIITEAVVTMANRLGMRVVAEGVETVDQLATVAGLGIGLAQGFLISAALPVETILHQGIAGFENGLLDLRHPVNRSPS